MDDDDNGADLGRDSDAGDKPRPIQQYQVDLWAKWADQLRAKVNEAMESYRLEKRRNAFWQRATGVTLLVASVLAPIFTASSNGSLGPYLSTSAIAIVLSATVAILVGLRRIFQFELRARNAALAIRDLQEARERFRDRDGTFPFASPEWIKAYQEYRDSYFGLARRETINFNSTLADRIEEGSGGSAPQRH